MKTKQSKEELDKIDDDAAVEPKTRARKKASDLIDEEKNKQTAEEPKSSKNAKKNVSRPKVVIRKPLIRKIDRSERTQDKIRKPLNRKIVRTEKNKLKNVTKLTTRGRRQVLKIEPDNSQEKETVPLIPVFEIKKEPLDDPTPLSRSSSPKTASRRQRLTSDMAMMKSVLADSPSSLVLGPRTSPYSMRSERSNSPSLIESKNLRSGKPRKAKPNLLNEVVMNAQKKRRRLLSDSKNTDTLDIAEDGKKLKRGRSCSRDGSEISKCSDVTESDVSISEPVNDSDNKELNKKLDKPKTDVDLDIESNINILTIEKVPSLSVDSKLSETKTDKRKLSLKRSTSLDSDNNNSNRLKLGNLNSADIEDKLLLKTENDTLFEARSSILTSMSKTFNSKEMSKNIRKARRGRKAATVTRPTPALVVKNGMSNTITNDPVEDKQETLETLSKEIDDLINDLDQNIDRDHETVEVAKHEECSSDQMQTKSVSKFYGVSKPLGDNNSIIVPETPMKELITAMANESTPCKNDDSENIRLHYEDSAEKSTDGSKLEVTYKCTTVASIDKLMDRLKEFEEFDKRRQRQESESKSSDSKSVMVSNDVVLIPKSGADIKPLKDLQSVRSPEKPIEKENVLSCFENNSAISILKRDQVRKSVDIDLPNSVTLIKRNSISARKESTNSNHSKETDAISIFEKSLGKDVTLTEIRKSVEKPLSTQVDLHQFATLHPNKSSIGGVVLDSTQISITPCVTNELKFFSGDAYTKRKSRDSKSRKSSESTNEPDENMAVIEKIKSPLQLKNVITITSSPAAMKSPEAVQTMDTEALAPPLKNISTTAEDISLTTEISEVDSIKLSDNSLQKTEEKETLKTLTVVFEAQVQNEVPKVETILNIDNSKSISNTENETNSEIVLETSVSKVNAITEQDKTPVKSIKSSRSSTECQAGPSNVLQETPESQKRKENILRTLGLLTHKAANEAKIEKLKEKERIYGLNYGTMNKSKSAKSGDYTGTLKTVIKLNRGSGDRDKKKYRSSLKMTFQKSKNRVGKPTLELGDAANEDDTYYTIERREGVAGATTDGGHRKSHYSNRLNNHDVEAAPEPVESKEIVIPEKASSFSIHPGRLCMDQCFYCGGKFGLFDTPCHIAQMKSSERQKKVLDNEEKLTIDSCLCDACYRHVDRRANCPSYRKRPVPSKQPDPVLVGTPPQPQQQANSVTDKSISPPLEEESDEESPVPTLASGRPAICHTEGCTVAADHSIRRKWLIKMRNSVNKLLKLKNDYPGLHTIPLCAEHHRALAPLMICALCRRRITKHHNVHFIHHGFADLNPILSEAGIPVQFLERPLLCKMCRYYCTLLQRPSHNNKHARGYRRRLLEIYNIEVPPDSEHEGEETTEATHEDLNTSLTKQKKKIKSKSKRKSSEPEKPDSESSEKTNDSPEKERAKEDIIENPQEHLEEDIESLISSNKILVPGAMKPNETPSDGSETDPVFDMEGPLIPLDKQTELQYLLQKQNNPAQFLNNQPNLIQKNRNLLKIQKCGIQKPGQQQRIHDKNSKKIHKLGQIIVHKEKNKKDDIDINELEKSKESLMILKNIPLNEECTIESIVNKKPADISTLKSKWQMSESFSQVKKNLSELSKKSTVGKDPKKSGDAKYSNPVKRLETNPSISVRELFPGEEEMNLQCNIDFNNVKGVTPEGWEKCLTTIQYDIETKKLWNELQRPYGNQSSFLRHLVLLEKYFRSGDLVLAQNATPHAANYSDSVQSRLRAYDNIVTDAPRRGEPAISLIEFRKKPNNKSLLKSNQNIEEKESKKCMPPPEIFPKPKPKIDKSKSKPMPPELIAINTPTAQGRKAIQNVLQNIQQLVKGVSAADPTEVAAAPLPPPKPDHPKEKKEIPKLEASKRQKTTKPWRPTLMPITQENLAKIAREPNQIAVDGRSLPSLVQVMSSGKRYHITLQDYNKMCIMRREKLQQLQDGDPKTKRHSTDSDTTLITEVQTSTMLGNGGTVMQNITQENVQEKKDMPDLGPISSNAATILKNVGLKNITIAPIPPKTATVTSQTIPSPAVTSPSLLVTTPLKIPQLGPAVSITSDAILTPNLPIITTPMVMPKIPKSLTVIPQTMVNVPQSLVVTAANVPPAQAVMHTERP